MYMMVYMLPRVAQQLPAARQGLPILTNRRPVRVEPRHLFRRQSNLAPEYLQHLRRGTRRCEKRRVLVERPEGELDGIALRQRVFDLV